MSSDYSLEQKKPYVFFNVTEQEFSALITEKKKILQEAYAGHETLYAQMPLNFLWNEKKNLLGIVVKDDLFNDKSKGKLLTQQFYETAEKNEQEIITRMTGGLEARLASMRPSKKMPEVIPTNQTIALPAQLHPAEPPREIDPLIFHIFGNNSCN